MEFSEDEVREFETEAEELLDSGEEALLALDRGESFSQHYDSIFRVFHSLKGAAGMMELTRLQEHLHELESHLSDVKGQGALSKPAIDFFLKGTDGARRLLRGETIEFSYAFPAAETAPPPAPAVVSAAPSAPAPAAPAKVSAASLVALDRMPAAKVFLIDDEAEVLEILKQVLEGAGLEVTAFNDPLKAVEEFESQTPDAIVTDLTMPGLDGLGVLERARKLLPDVPVIFISGNVDKAVALDAISKGVYSMIEKPFNVGHVITTVVNACRKHQLTRLFRRSVKLIMYQFSDLDAYLAKQNKDDVRKVIRREIETLLESQNQLAKIQSSSSKP